MCNGNQEFARQFAQFGDRLNFKRDVFKAAVRNGQFPLRSHFLAHIPRRMQQIIKRCLEVDPQNRYSSMIQILNDLAQFDDEELDWRYEETAQGRQWSKSEGDKGISLLVEPSGRSVALKNTSQQNRRITNYCLESIDEVEIRKFLKDPR